MNEKNNSTSKKPRLNVSVVWEHFILKKTTAGTTERYFCKYSKCDTSYSKNSATTAMIAHLQNNHELKLIVEKTEINKDRVMQEKRDRDDGSESDEDESISLRQVTSTFTDKSKYGQQTQKELDQLLLCFIVQDVQAFHLCSSVPFRNLVEKLDPKWVMPSRQTIREHINLAYIKEKDSIKNMLEKIESKVSLTTDGWDSLSVDQYLGLTCHFIDDDWVMQEILLDFGDSPRPHSGLNLSETITEVNK